MTQEELKQQRKLERQRKRRLKRKIRKIALRVFYGAAGVCSVFLLYNIYRDLNSGSTVNTNNTVANAVPVKNSKPSENTPINTKLNAQISAQKVVKPTVAPTPTVVPKNTFNIKAPMIDNLTLGSSVTSLPSNYEVEKSGTTTIGFSPNQYNIFGFNASYTFEAHDNKIDKMTLSYKGVDAPKLIEQVRTAVPFDLKYCLKNQCNASMRSQNTIMAFYTNGAVATIVYARIKE